MKKTEMLKVVSGCTYNINETVSFKVPKNCQQMEVIFDGKGYQILFHVRRTPLVALKESRFFKRMKLKI